MQKTVTVTLTRRFAHAIYGKMMTRTITVKARDEHGAKVGDTVRLMETRPLAKTVQLARDRDRQAGEVARMGDTE